MWRLGKYLVDQCIYKDQEVLFIGNIAAKVQNIFVNGKMVRTLLLYPLSN